MRRLRLWNVLPWLVLAAAVVGTDVAAFRWVVSARSTITTGLGNGHWTRYEMYDGSGLLVVYNNETGQTVRRVVTGPATMLGLCRTWCPAVFGSGLTLMPLGFVRRETGSWLLPDAPEPRLTTRLWMIVVAVAGVEFGLMVEGLQGSRALTLESGLNVAALIAVQLFFFIPMGIALFFRGRYGPVALVNEPAIDG